MSRTLTAGEEFAVKARIEQARSMRDAERTRKHEQAAATVAEIWEAASPAAAEHPYLSRKRVQPHGARIGGDGRLILPLYNASGALSSYNTSTARAGIYHPGDAVGGCFYDGNANGQKQSTLPRASQRPRRSAKRYAPTVAQQREQPSGCNWHPTGQAPGG